MYRRFPGTGEPNRILSHRSLERQISMIFTKQLALAATLAVAALTIVPTVANAAGPTFYSTLLAFQTAAPPTTNSDFNGIAPAGGTTTNPAVLTVPQAGRVTFSVTGGNNTGVIANSSSANGGAYQLSDGTDSVAAGNPNSGGSTTTIALGGSYTAFGIEYGMESNFTLSFSFALFNGTTQVGSANNAGSAGGDRFFGATSPVAFDTVRVVANPGAGAFVVFDNARVGGGVAVVPEASTLALLLPAFAALTVGAVVVHRRRTA